MLKSISIQIIQVFILNHQWLLKLEVYFSCGNMRIDGSSGGANRLLEVLKMALTALDFRI